MIMHGVNENIIRVEYHSFEYDYMNAYQKIKKKESFRRIRWHFNNRNMG